MKKCPNCGFEVGENHKFCTNCGFNLDDGGIVKNNQSANTSVNQANTPQVSTQSSDMIDETYRSNAKTLMTIHYCLLGFPVITTILSFLGINLNFLSGLCSTGALGTIIAARIKYGKLKYVRITFIIEMVLIVLEIVAIILIIVACVNFFENLPSSSGCD